LYLGTVTSQTLTLLHNTSTYNFTTTSADKVDKKKNINKLVKH